MKGNIFPSQSSHLTVICREVDNEERINVMGLNTLDSNSRRILDNLTREVFEPTALKDGFEIPLPMGCAKRLARTIASTLSLRGVAVLVA